MYSHQVFPHYPWIHAILSSREVRDIVGILSVLNLCTTSNYFPNQVDGLLFIDQTRELSQARVVCIITNFPMNLSQSIGCKVTSLLTDHEQFTAWQEWKKKKISETAVNLTSECPYKLIHTCASAMHVHLHSNDRIIT